MGHSFILLENDVGRVTAYVRFNQSAQYFVEMKKNMIAMSKNMLELLSNFFVIKYPKGM